MFGWTALSDDSEAVVVKVSEAVGTALYQLHFSMEALSDAIVFGEAPHTGDLLLPGVQGPGQGGERSEAAVGQLLDECEEALDDRAALLSVAMLDGE